VRLTTPSRSNTTASNPSAADGVVALMLRRRGTIDLEDASPVRRPMCRRGVRKVVALIDRLDQPIVDVCGPPEAVLLFKLPHLRGKEVIAEDIADPPRKVAPSQVSIQFFRRSSREDLDQLIERARPTARGLSIRGEDERPPVRNRHVQLLLSVPDV